MPKPEKERGDGGDVQTQLFAQGVLAAIIVLAVGMVLLISTKNAQQGFSQIYLDEKALPKTIGAGSPYPVTFIIQNFEGRDASYSYEIMDANGFAMKTGGAIVENNGRKTIKETVQLRQRSVQKIFIHVKVDGGRELSLFFPVTVV